MKTIVLKPQNVCTYEMILNVDDNDIIQSLEVKGGCQGNLRGVAKLCEGRKLQDISELLSGITCRGSRTKQTSCPDQLAQGIKEYLNSK